MESQFSHIIRQKIIDSQAQPLPQLTQRDCWLPAVPNKATAVIGMRRAGKTSLLWQLLAERHQRGVPREGLLYFSFEDERLIGMAQQDLQSLVEEYYRLHPGWRDARRATFFLDEIQLVPGWEQFARRLLDSEQIDLFLSGSSARLLSREVASSMRGRAMEAIVRPFSFREVLRHQRREPAITPASFTKAQHSQLDKDVLHYLGCGGFPEAQNLDERNRLELLRTYVDVVLLRDVVERHNLSQPQALRAMVRQLLAKAGSLFSINKLHGDFKSRGIAIAKDTLHFYLSCLEDAFLLNTITVVSGSERRRQVNPRKVYPVDMGLMALFGQTGSGNSGHALETAVFHELHRRGAELGYVRTEEGYEVDFLARFPGETWLIQVCATLDSPDTLQRELRALEAARLEHPEARLLLITMQRPGKVQLPKQVKLTSAGEWLLG